MLYLFEDLELVYSRLTCTYFFYKKSLNFKFFLSFELNLKLKLSIVCLYFYYEEDGDVFSVNCPYLSKYSTYINSLYKSLTNLGDIDKYLLLNYESVDNGR